MDRDHSYQRVAGAVRDRRAELGLTQRQAAEATRSTDTPVSVATWTKVENAVDPPYHRRTIQGISHVLGWAPDSFDRLLRGEEPVEVTHRPPGRGRALTLDERLRAVEAHITPSPPRPGETFEERIRRVEQQLGLDDPQLMP